MMKKLFLAIFATTLLGLFVSAQTVSTDNSYFTYKSADQNQKNKWVLLLPGSSGLTIFDDKTFYNRQAEALQKQGFDVILLDYRAYFEASNDKNKPKKTIGEKVAWVIKNALKDLRNKNLLNADSKGHLIGWSLAGEGIFRVLKDSGFIEENRIKSVGLFYPSNLENIPITTTIPLLIQIGNADKTVDANKLRSQIGENKMVKFVTYANCFHGFDVDTIASEKTLRFPPIVGKKHTFLYDKEAATKSRQVLFEFLSE